MKQIGMHMCFNLHIYFPLGLIPSYPAFFNLKSFCKDLSSLG